MGLLLDYLERPAGYSSTSSWRDSTTCLAGASCGPDQLGLGQQLTLHAIGTTAQQTVGDFTLAHHWDGSPRQVICHSTRREKGDPSGTLACTADRWAGGLAAAGAQAGGPSGGCGAMENDPYAAAEAVNGGSLEQEQRMGGLIC